MVEEAKGLSSLLNFLQLLLLKREGEFSRFPFLEANGEEHR